MPMKPFTRLTITVLSGILVLLGFGACKSSKKAFKDRKNVTIIRDTIHILRTSDVTDPVRPIRDPGVQKVVYGPPPAAYRNNLK